MKDAAEEVLNTPLSPASADRMDRVDMALSATGIALALFAAFFPWYVFFNHDKFVIDYSGLVQHLKRDLPVRPPRPVFSVSPSASININKADRTPPPSMRVPKDLDALTTATLPDAAASLGADPSAIEQPLPPAAAGAFRLLHVAGGRALIEDSGGIYMVEKGNVLPDNSVLQSIEQRDGRWMIVTSRGDIFAVN